MPDYEDTRLENIRERIQRNGPGAEILRQAYIERLRSHIEAFYEHGSLADLLSLCAAFDALEGEECGADDLHRARLVEKLTAAGGSLCSPPPALLEWPESEPAGSEH
jgi:hypothetical protein